MSRDDPVDGRPISAPIGELNRVRPVSYAAAESQHDALSHDVGTYCSSAKRESEPVLPMPPDDLLERYQGRRLEEDSLKCEISDFRSTIYSPQKEIPL